MRPNVREIRTNLPLGTSQTHSRGFHRDNPGQDAFELAGIFVLRQSRNATTIIVGVTVAPDVHFPSFGHGVRTNTIGEQYETSNQVPPLKTKKKNNSHLRDEVSSADVRRGFHSRPLKLGATVFVVAVLGIATWTLARDRTPTVHGFEIVKTYTHDRQAYCQGLIVADGVLYEGTGQYGKSCLRKVDLATGKVLQQVDLDKNLFGEGITVWEGHIIQLTWRSGLGIIYNKESLEKVRTFEIRGEGWGLTHDGKHLVVSDGTSILQFLDPSTFRVVKRLTVFDRKAQVWNLNELEYVNGEILANVWKRDHIVRISPKTGKVLGWIDLRGLKPAEVRRDPEAVLNGIAYDAKNKRLYVTGKNWPTLFEIRLKQLQ
jgi:glutaminyl-peptide cyclotransferase